MSPKSSEQLLFVIIYFLLTKTHRNYFIIKLTEFLLSSDSLNVVNSHQLFRKTFTSLLFPSKVLFLKYSSYLNNCFLLFISTKQAFCKYLPLLIKIILQSKGKIINIFITLLCHFHIVNNQVI